MTMPSTLRRARIAGVAALAGAILTLAPPALASPPAHAKVPANSPALAWHGPDLFSPLQGLTTVEAL